jgi:hypothetical protein
MRAGELYVRVSAGASIAGGMLAYLFMDDVGSDPSHKVNSRTADWRG